MINVDWFIKLKTDIVLLCKCEEYLEELKKQLFVTFPWFFSDENTLKWNARVNEITAINGKAIQSFIKYIDLLEETGKEFSKGNLMDEFSLIRENYVIGVSYFMNIASYISNKQDFKNTLDQHDSLARFSNNDTDCYNLIKINDDLLKKYRKEWRD